MNSQELRSYTFVVMIMCSFVRVWIVITYLQKMLDHMWIVLVLIRIETRMIMMKDDDSGGDDDAATGAGGGGQKNLEDNTCNSTFYR